MTGKPPEPEDLTAAEYVLGLLDAGQRRDAEARLAGDPAFAREVDDWQGRLGALTDLVVAVEPPATAWPLIERATGGNVAAFPPRAAATPDRRVIFWRAWAVGATGIAAGALLMLGSVMTQAPPHMMTATVRTVAGAADVVVSYDPKTHDLMLTPVGDKPPAGQVPHLWLMKKDGSMQLIGPLSMDHPGRRHITDEEMKQAQGTMGVGISLEPAGLKPGAKPTGPIVASGAFVRL